MSTAAGTVQVVAGADLWVLWDDGRWAVIPTNRQRRADGTAVMGAGLAKAAARRHPDLEARYGASLSRGQDRLAVTGARLLLAPTKDHWRDPATLELTRAAADGCAAYARARGIRLVVPALGCGLGGLEWSQVEPELIAAFDGCDAVLIAPQ